MTKEKTSEDEDIGKIYELGKWDDIFLNEQAQQLYLNRILAASII